LCTSFSYLRLGVLTGHASTVTRSCRCLCAFFRAPLWINENIYVQNIDGVRTQTANSPPKSCKRTKKRRRNSVFRFGQNRWLKHLRRLLVLDAENEFYQDLKLSWWWSVWPYCIGFKVKIKETTPHVQLAIEQQLWLLSPTISNRSFAEASKAEQFYSGFRIIWGSYYWLTLGWKRSGHWSRI
jgi:hypothetical protein